jgi:hypothetical protein
MKLEVEAAGHIAKIELAEREELKTAQAVHDLLQPK